MDWISVEEKLPECWSQHGSSFGSGYLLTRDKNNEYHINQFWEHGDHTSEGWVMKSQRWEEMNGFITHWCNIIPPKDL